MLKLKYFPSILTKENRTCKEIEYDKNKSLREYVKDYDLKENRIIVSGGIPDNLDVKLKDNDEIIVTPKIEGPIFATIASIVGMVMSAFGAGSVAVWGSVLMVGAAIYTLATQKKPSFGSFGGGAFESSPTYGWDGIQTTINVGTPVPIIYGTHRVGGNAINVYTDFAVKEIYNWEDASATGQWQGSWTNTFSTTSSSIYGLKFTLTGYGWVPVGETHPQPYEGKYKVYYRINGTTDWTYYSTVVSERSDEQSSTTYDNVSIEISELTGNKYDVKVVAIDGANLSTWTDGNMSGISLGDVLYSNVKRKTQGTTNDWEKQRLNILIAACEGEIESMSNIKVNDNPIENYYQDDVASEIAFRTGTNSQSAIDGFGDLHNNYTQTVTLTQNNPWTYTTADSNVEGIKLSLQCPGGLYHLTDSGNVESWSITYSVEYRIHGSGSYTHLGSYTITAKSRSATRRYFKTPLLSANKYDIRITRTSSDEDLSHYYGSLSLTNIDEIKTQNLIYPNTALLGIKMLATDQLSGGMPNVTFLVRGKKIRIPDVKYGGQSIDWEDYYWDSDNSEFRRFLDDGSCTWDNTYITGYCANPAWCVRDLLLNDRFGLGEYITTSNLDEAKFLEMAKHCDERLQNSQNEWEKRFRLDVVIDGESSSLDLIQQLAMTFRGMPVYSEGIIKLLIEKSETATQLFTMGNIIKDSFQMSYASEKQVPNIIEFQFSNKNKDYERDTLEIGEEKEIASGKPQRKETISMFGITRVSQLHREGAFILRRSQKNTKVISFKAGIDAVACSVGDVIGFQHDVPQWGLYGGRVEGGTTTSVQLDQEITLESDKTYEIEVRNSTDDTIETKTITDSAGSYTTVNVDSVFSFTPADYDVYAIGEENRVTKPYRIVSIRRTGYSNVEITAVQYLDRLYDYADVYDSDWGEMTDEDGNTIYEYQTPVEPKDDYSYLILDVPTVTNVSASERIATLSDGSLQNAIDVSFDWPTPDDRWVKKLVSVDVLISDDGGISWIKDGNTDENYYTILGGIEYGTTYTIALVSITDNNEKSVLANSPTDTVTILGKTDAPDDVVNISAVFTDEIKFTWDAITDTDLGGYEIRIEDADWGSDDDELIWRGKGEKWIEVRPSARSGVTYYIKAFNTSGVYSNSATSVTPTNPAPSAPTVRATAYFEKGVLKWNEVLDADLLYYEVWTSSNNSWSGEEELLARDKTTVKVVEIQHNPTYYKIRGVDTYGTGAFSTSVNMYPVTISGTSITDGGITTPKLATACVTTEKIDTLAVTAVKINVDDSIRVGASGASNVYIDGLNSRITTGATPSTGVIIIDGADEIIKIYDDSSNLMVELGKLS